MSARNPLDSLSPSAEPQSYPLEKARQAFVRAAQGIAGQHRDINFTWNGQQARLTFSNLADPCPAKRVAKVSLDGHVLQVRLERLPDVSSVSASLAGIDLEGLPAELACGVLAAAFEPGLRELKSKGVDLALEELKVQEPASLPPEESLCWTVDRGADTGWMRGTLSGDDAALLHLANVVSKIPVKPVHAMSDVPMEMSVVAARVKVSQDELRELRRSDAILADLDSWRSGGACEVLVAGRRFATATLQGTALTIQQLTMTEPSPSPAPSETLTAVDQLEVELTFVVGSHTATLEQLRSLAPGACIELSSSIAQGVTICANGRAIGRGELLDIGNRIGVRITELASS